MKQYLSLVLGLMIIASPALASRARLESLGEGKNGSYYLQDSRNMFLNPSQIVHYKKKFLLELGSDPVGTGTYSATNGKTYTYDQAVAPRAQGGMINTFGDFTYALYLDQTSERAISGVNAANAIMAGAGAGSDFFIAPDQQIEAFFAGEGSLNWGLSLLYAGNNSKAVGKAERTASLFGTRLGIEQGSLQFYTTVGISSNSKVISGTTNPEIKGKLSVDAALTYGMDNLTWFAKFSTWGTDLVMSAASTVQNRNSLYGLGFGYKNEASKTVTLYSRLEMDYQKTSNDGPANIPGYKFWDVPLVFGAEAAALSWLTVRGSISHVLFGQQLGSAGDAQFRSPLNGTTTVSTGVGMTFGDVSVDALVATTGVNNPNSASPAAPGLGTAPQSDNTFGFGDALLSRVALTYSF